MAKETRITNRIVDRVIDDLIRGAVHFLIFLFAGELNVSGRNNIPKNGPYIVVVNHMSKADPPLIMISFPGVRMRFFAGEKWKKHLIFGPLLSWEGGIFINRGEVDRVALNQSLRSLENGSIFGLAPEGTRSKIGALIMAKDGAAYLATRSKVPVLPVGIVNTDILGHNMAGFRRTEIGINIGKPFNVPDLGRRPKGDELSAYTHLIMIHIAALLPDRHRGYYADSPALKALLAGQDPWAYCLEAENVQVAVAHERS